MNFPSGCFSCHHPGIVRTSSSAFAAAPSNVRRSVVSGLSAVSSTSFDRRPLIDEKPKPPTSLYWVPAPSSSLNPDPRLIDPSRWSGACFTTTAVSNSRSRVRTCNTSSRDWPA